MFFGRASECTDYFANIGFMCPEQFNPADFYLDVISMDYRSKELEETTRERIVALAGRLACRL
jgi:ABC-2 type transporter